jgi:hypothetical protein
MKMRHFKIVGNIILMHMPRLYRICENEYAIMKYGGHVNHKNNFYLN